MQLVHMMGQNWLGIADRSWFIAEAMMPPPTSSCTRHMAHVFSLKGYDYDFWMSLKSISAPFSQHSTSTQEENYFFEPSWEVLW